MSKPVLKSRVLIGSLSTCFLISLLFEHTRLKSHPLSVCNLKSPYPTCFSSLSPEIHFCVVLYTTKTEHPRIVKNWIVVFV